MLFNTILALPFILLGSFQPLVTFSGKCSRLTISTSPLPSPLPTLSPKSFTKLTNLNRRRCLLVLLPYSLGRAYAPLPRTFPETSLPTQFLDPGNLLYCHASLSRAKHHPCALARSRPTVTHRSWIDIALFSSSDWKWNSRWGGRSRQPAD